MNFCWTHIYSGAFACPWPECANGRRESEFEFHGKRISRQRFEGGAEPLYAWVIDGVTAASVAAQFTRRAIAQVNGAPSLAEDGYLYHFTSALGAKGILASGELWLTDYRDLSDEEEIRDGVSVARATFDDLRHELSGQAKSILGQLATSPLPEGVYVTCFSMLKDSPHHWHEFAKDSSGAAIVFEPLGFEDMIKCDPFAVQFTRVAYIWDVKAGLFVHMACALDEVSRFDLQRGLFDEASYIREMTQIFGELLPMCKDVSLLREHEVRLFVSPALSKWNLADRLVARHQNGRRYITTREVLPAFCLPIEKVVLGPNFEGNGQELNVNPAKLERAAG